MKKNTKRTEPTWNELARNEAKAQLAKHGMTYQDLSNALAKINIEKSPDNLGKTIREGKFSHAFFLSIKNALNADLSPREH